jgi:hypothetical protein
MDERTIEDWCEYLKLFTYQIHTNGLVYVIDGHVNIINKNLSKIPIQFGIVNGNFYCGNNKIISLKGCPTEVLGDFFCNSNGLKSLKCAPRKVGRDFSCFNNLLTSLEGSPKEVGGSFFCDSNLLTSLNGGPRKVGNKFNCVNNPVHAEYCHYGNYEQCLRYFKLKQLLWTKDQ